MTGKPYKVGFRGGVRKQWQKLKQKQVVVNEIKEKLDKAASRSYG